MLLFKFQAKIQRSKFMPDTKQSFHSFTYWLMNIHGIITSSSIKRGSIAEKEMSKSAKTPFQRQSRPPLKQQASSRIPQQRFFSRSVYSFFSVAMTFLTRPWLFSQIIPDAIMVVSPVCFRQHLLRFSLEITRTES